MKIYPFFLQNAGCPHRCSFCSQERSVASSISPAEDVANELESILPQRGDGEIAFYGGTFTLLPLNIQEEYLCVAARFVKAGRVAGIRVSTRPDALDEPCLARLEEAGVSTIEIGCQSFDDHVLNAAVRGHSAAANISAVQRCLAVGFQVGIQLMPGLQESSADEALFSLRAALQLKPSFLRIYPAVVIEGTDQAKQWRQGVYSPLSLDDAVDVCADMLSECRKARVPVIRIGLQQDPQLQENLLAGPYHPAFGQLVRSRLWRRAISTSVNGSTQFIVNPIDLSDVIGHGGENRQWFRENCPGVSLQTDQNVLPGSLRFLGQELTLNELSTPGGLNG